MLYDEIKYFVASRNKHVKRMLEEMDGKIHPNCAHMFVLIAPDSDILNIKFEELDEDYTRRYSIIMYFDYYGNKTTKNKAAYNVQWCSSDMELGPHWYAQYN